MKYKMSREGSGTLEHFTPPDGLRISQGRMGPSVRAAAKQLISLAPTSPVQGLAILVQSASLV